MPTRRNTKCWLDTESPEGASAAANAFWRKAQADVREGTFWADRIKDLRDEPGKRLALALENLPLPGAFREAAVALRAIIRALRRQRKPFEEPLNLLYWLAATESFMVDFAPILKEPGFNVMESIPGEVVRGLDFSYSTLGFNRLRLLNATDTKWLTEIWGEPKGHTTLHKLHQRTWDKFEMSLHIRRQRDQDQFLYQLRAGASPPRKRWWQLWQ